MIFGLIYGLFNILYIVAFNGTDPYGHDFVYSIIGPVHLKQGYTYEYVHKYVLKSMVSLTRMMYLEIFFEFRARF